MDIYQELWEPILERQQELRDEAKQEQRLRNACTEEPGAMDQLLIGMGQVLVSAGKSLQARSAVCQAR